MKEASGGKPKWNMLEILREHALDTKIQKKQNAQRKLKVKVETEGGVGAPKSGKKHRDLSLIGQKLFSLLSLILYLYTIERIQFNDPRKYPAILQLQVSLFSGKYPATCTLAAL